MRRACRSFPRATANLASLAIKHRKRSPEGVAGAKIFRHAIHNARPKRFRGGRSPDLHVCSKTYENESRSDDEARLRRSSPFSLRAKKFRRRITVRSSLSLLKASAMKPEAWTEPATAKIFCHSTMRARKFSPEGRPFAGFVIHFNSGKGVKLRSSEPCSLHHSAPIPSRMALAVARKALKAQ
jgi:hypothetical protein